MSHIIKRRGHPEVYDERKVYASAYAASLNAHLNKFEAEKIAGEVAREITSWIEEREGTSSEDIFGKIIESLERRNAAAAFLYETHRDLS